MTKEEIVDSIKSDVELMNMLTNLNESELSHENYLQCARKANEYVFKKFCLKSYLDSCEPEYCTYRVTDTCPYLIAISYISEDMGINLIK